MALRCLSFQEECLGQLAFATNLERLEVLVPGTGRRLRLGLTPQLELVEIFCRYLAICDPIEEVLAKICGKISPPILRH